MSERTMSGVGFFDCTFRGTRFNGSTFRDVAFANCTFIDCGFFDVRFSSCKLVGAMFDGCRFGLVHADGGDWSLVGLPGADLRSATFTDVRMREADLTGARLDGATVRNVDLSGALLRADVPRRGGPARERPVGARPPRRGAEGRPHRRRAGAGDRDRPGAAPRWLDSGPCTSDRTLRARASGSGGSRPTELTAAEIAAIRDLLWAAFPPGEEGFTEADWEHAHRRRPRRPGPRWLARRARLGRGAGPPCRRPADPDGLRRGCRGGPGATGLRSRDAGHARDRCRDPGERYELGALGTGAHHFYERLGWQVWRGPLFVRTDDGDRRTSGGGGRHPRAGDARRGRRLDVTAPLDSPRVAAG